MLVDRIPGMPRREEEDEPNIYSKQKRRSCGRRHFLPRSIEEGGIPPLYFSLSPLPKKCTNNVVCAFRPSEQAGKPAFSHSLSPITPLGLRRTIRGGRE